MQPGYILMTLLTLAMVLLLITLVETVVLQLLGWGALRSAISAALKMNLLSALAAFPILGFATSQGLPSLGVAWAVSVILESAVLIRLRQGATVLNLMTAVIANLASYLILILPAWNYRG